MRGVVISEPGDPEVLRWNEVPDPAPAPGDVLVEVVAAGVNRADVMQRRGFYPPPPGASDLPGLECSGRVAAVGQDVTGWQVGDQVCALLAGGGYAERVAVPASQLLPAPAGVDLVTAASLPEVLCTVWSNLFMVAGLRPGETLLVHGGAGGIGSAAIQLGKLCGATVLATAGSAAKLHYCVELGADAAFDYHESDFVAATGEATDGRGADVILDVMGAAYLGRNVDALAVNGRLVVIGLQGGTRAELDLGALLRKRGAVIATTLRSRPVPEKSAIVAAVTEHVWPLLADGRLRTTVSTTLPMREAAAAHRLMESGAHTGKIVLTTGSR